MGEHKYVQYEIDGRVAAITLDRADKANSQNERMLDELDACFDRAERDDEVRVIVLRGAPAPGAVERPPFGTKPLVAKGKSTKRISLCVAAAPAQAGSEPGDAGDAAVAAHVSDDGRLGF